MSQDLELKSFISKYQNQSSELSQLRDRIHQLEQQLELSLTHESGCTCHCPGRNARSSSKSSAKDEKSSSSMSDDPNTSSVMNILFGDSSTAAKSSKSETAAISKTDDATGVDHLLHQLDSTSSPASASRKRKLDTEAPTHKQPVIRISSPPATSHAAPSALPTSQLPLSAVPPPSQDAYDQLEAEQVSRGFDYDADEFALDEHAEETQKEQRRLKWTQALHGFNHSALSAAAKEANQSKEHGNNEFTVQHYSAALELYTRGIHTLEKALSRMNIKSWVELVAREEHSGPAAIEEELAAIKVAQSSLTDSAHGSTSTDAYHQMKSLLRQLSSIHANLATCSSKSKSNDAALKSVEKAIELQPAWFKGYSIQASIYYSLKKYDAACFSYEKALQCPNISAEDKQKVNDRLVLCHTAVDVTEKQRAKKQKTGHSHQPLSPTHSIASSVSGRSNATKPVAAEKPVPAPAKPAAGSPAGSPPTTEVPAAAGESEMMAMMTDFPVHPPSLHTPIGGGSSSVTRQESDSAGRGGDAMDIDSSAAIEAQKKKDDAEAKQREKEAAEVAAKAKAKAKADAEAARARSPARDRVPTSILHAPHSDVSHLSPPNSASKPKRVISPPQGDVLDLTSSPPRSSRNTLAAPSSGSSTRSTSAVKTEGGRSREPSPARSPARSTASRSSPTASPKRDRSPVENWYRFPLVNIEGIRDLIGDEAFAQAIELKEQKRLLAFKTVPATTEEGGDQPWLYGIIMKSELAALKKQGKHLPTPSELEQSNDVYHVKIRFQEFGLENRVKQFTCDCHTAERNAAEESKAAENENSPNASNESTLMHAASSSSSKKKSWPACQHVGALLLQLLSKQDEMRKNPVNLLGPHEEARRRMFVHPSRRMSAEQLAKEAQMRQELENLSNARLAEMLGKNNQRKSGSKSELAARIIENRMRGNLPRCDICDGGLFYANGGYHCHGKYDITIKKFLACPFYAEQVQRSQWIP